MNILLPPNLHASAVMLLTVIALVLFMRDRIPRETSSLLILVALLVGFELFPYRVNGQIALRGVDFLRDFGNPALIAVMALVIAGQGLIRTGALEPVGRWLGRLWAVRPQLSLLLTLFVTALISAFVNHTAVLVVMLPLLVDMARRAKVPASRIVMPVGIGTLIGGMTTVIGTATNLLVVGVAEGLGMRPMGVFGFTLPAAIVGAVGLLYLWLVAPRLLPQHTPAEESSPRSYTADLSVEPDSPTKGKTVAEAIERAGGEMDVVGVHRHGQRRGQKLVKPLPDVTLRPGDELRVKGTPDDLKEFEHVLGGKLDVSKAGVEEEIEERTKDLQIAEAALTPSSPLVGQSLNNAQFAARYQLATLAIHHNNRPIDKARKELGDVILRVGDIVLLEGSRENIAELRRSGELLVLDPIADVPLTAKAPIALVIMAAVVLVAAFGLLPIAVSTVTGVLLMIVTGCMTWRSVGSAMSGPIILLIVVSLALGTALQKTGGAEYLSRLFVQASAGAPPAVVLSGVMLLALLLTYLLSNHTTGIIGTPIAISIAHQIHQPVEPFVLAVLFGANMAFAFPTETNVLVLNAGRYSFAQLAKVGSILALIMWIGFSLVLPWFYGL